jgi:hypothetical protein
MIQRHATIRNNYIVLTRCPREWEVEFTTLQGRTSLHYDRSLLASLRYVLRRLRRVRS